MKLCIVNHNFMKGDGQGRVNYEVAWEAVRRGHQVTLLATQVAPELQNNDLVTWVHISVNRIPTQLFKNLFFSRKTSSWLKKHRSEFDLIQLNGALTSGKVDINAFHFVHSSWLRSPAHISRQNRNLYGAYQWLFTWSNACWEKKAAHQASLIVAVSNKVKQEMIEIGTPQEKIKVILNGVDLQEFSPGMGDRSRWGLPSGVTLALFVGDIKSSRKNLDTVLRALVQLPNLHLAVVGSTKDSPYPQLAKILGVSDRVYFLGFRQDVSKIMQAVDVFVFPSRYEACTLVLLEAMASGLPIVSAATTGGVEIVTPECGVVLPDSENVSLLVQALKKLASYPNKRQQMGESARIIAEEYSWTKQAQKYVDLFEQSSTQ